MKTVLETWECLLSNKCRINSLMYQKLIIWNFSTCSFMQMRHFLEILIKLSLKYISCSLKRCNIHVCILNGYKVMPFWQLKGPFGVTAIIYGGVLTGMWHVHLAKTQISCLFVQSDQSLLLAWRCFRLLVSHKEPSKTVVRPHRCTGWPQAFGGAYVSVST